MIGNAAQRSDEAGNLTDQSTKDHIRRLVESLVEWTRRLGGSPLK
jgi:hypothetical protein